MDLARLEGEYYTCWPDVGDPTQRVSFGTGGHRGSPLQGSCTEAHILAITQADRKCKRSFGAAHRHGLQPGGARLWLVLDRRRSVR